AQPDVGAEGETLALEIFVEAGDAGFEFGAFQPKLEVAEAYVEQLVVGQPGPPVPASRDARAFRHVSTPLPPGGAGGGCLGIRATTGTNERQGATVRPLPQPLPEGGELSAAGLAGGDERADAEGDIGEAE